MTALFTLALAIVLISAAARVTGMRSIVFVAIMIQSIFYLPIIFMFDPRSDIDIKFLTIHMFFYFSFIIFCIIFSLTFHPKRFRPPTLIMGPNRHARWNLLFFSLSLAVTILFYVNSGGLIFTRLASNDDPNGLRLSFYALYNTGAGYVNQFKNVLLPLTATALFFYLKGRKQLLFSVVTIPLLAILMTGTGQRFPLVFAILFLISVFFVLRGFQFDFKFVILLVGAVAGFGLITAAIGRGEGGILAAIMHLAERIFTVNQSSNLATFFYLDNRGFVAGQDWVEDIIGISVFARPSTIANELFSVLWGSTRGNAPPSLASSVFYNFHALGMILFPALLAFSVVRIGMLIEGKEITLSAFLALVFLSIVIGSWSTGGINSPLNRGALAIGLYLLCIRLKIRSNKSSQSERRTSSFSEHRCGL